MRRALVTFILLLALTASPAGAVLTLTGPVVDDFAPVQVTGLGSVTSTAGIGTWSVNATGTLTGWHVEVSATQLRAADGSTLPLGSMTYKGPTVAGGSGQLPALYPVVLASRVAPPAIDLSADGSSTVSVVNALLNTGSGVWDFTQGSADLGLTVPLMARAGTYTSTVTFTLSAGPL